jgi:hypothetical protein
MTIQVDSIINYFWTGSVQILLFPHIVIAVIVRSLHASVFVLLMSWLHLEGSNGFGLAAAAGAPPRPQHHAMSPTILKCAHERLLIARQYSDLQKSSHPSGPGGLWFLWVQVFVYRKNR